MSQARRRFRTDTRRGRTRLKPLDDAARRSGWSFIRCWCLGTLLLAQVSSASAYTECVRQVRNVFSDLGGSVSVTFIDAGAAISKSESVTSAAGVSRFLAMALLAQTTGRAVKVRYPEDGAACPPAPGGTRSDFTGFWLMDQ